LGECMRAWLSDGKGLHGVEREARDAAATPPPSSSSHRPPRNPQPPPFYKPAPTAPQPQTVVELEHHKPHQGGVKVQKGQHHPVVHIGGQHLRQSVRHQPRDRLAVHLGLGGVFGVWCWMGWGGVEYLGDEFKMQGGRRVQARGFNFQRTPIASRYPPARPPHPPAHLVVKALDRDEGLPQRPSARAVRLPLQRQPPAALHRVGRDAVAPLRRQ